MVRWRELKRPLLRSQRAKSSYIHNVDSAPTAITQSKLLDVPAGGTITMDEAK